MNVKLEEGLYKDRDAFEADFRLMIKNCQAYNSAGTYAFNESLAVDTFFEKREYKIYHRQLPLNKQLP